MSEKFSIKAKKPTPKQTNKNIPFYYGGQIPCIFYPYW